MSVLHVAQTQEAAGGEANRPDIASEVLAVVTSLAEEIHPHQKGRAPGLGGDLDRDFGLDSLGRVEAIHRLEAVFNTTLPDRLFAEAATPSDLVRAVSKTGLSVGPQSATHVESRAAPSAVAAPERLATLNGVLAWHATHQPLRPHAYLSDGDRESEPITYGALAERAQRVAAGLIARGLEPGARIALMLPTGADFFAAFLGVLLAGGVPAPPFHSISEISVAVEKLLVRGGVTVVPVSRQKRLQGK